MLLLAASGTAAAQSARHEPGLLIGGSSECPTPGLVWDRLVAIVPRDVLLDRLQQPGGAVAPVQIVDLGTSFRVIAGARNRDFVEEARDCAKRAQFAAVFIAVVAGANTTANAPPFQSAPANTGITAPAVISAPAPTPRARLELGAVASAALGAGDAAAAPGLAFRTALGRRRFLPVAAVTVLAPLERTAGVVDIRQWQALADVSVRSPSHAIGRSRFYGELGATVELLVARPVDLVDARTEVSYAVGPRAAAGWMLETKGRLAPFLLIAAAWFPRPPDRFALPAGDLGRAPAWNIGATAGVSWGLL